VDQLYGAISFETGSSRTELRFSPAMLPTMLLDGRIEIHPFVRYTMSTHPLKEGGCAFERMTTGIIDQRVFDDRMDGPTLFAGQFMREIASFGTTNKE
jgi:hypothetical protein